MTGHESWERFKEGLMAVAAEAGERSTTETFGQNELGHGLEVDTSDPEQKGRLSEPWASS